MWNHDDETRLELPGPETDIQKAKETLKMDIRRAVSEFVSQGTGLFHRLRSKGEALSDVDLVTLREQLHILDTEADHLQNLKEFRSRVPASSIKRHVQPSMSRSQHRAA